MWININGVDKINEINSYYIDNSDGKLRIKFIDRNRYVAYDLDEIDIGPIEKGTLSDNQVFFYKGQINESKEYKKIGEKFIGILRNNKYIYYNSENVKIETFKDIEITSKEIVLIENEISGLKKISESDHCYKTRDLHGDIQYITEKKRLRIQKISNDKFDKILKYYKEIAIIKDLKMSNKAPKYLESQIEEMDIQKNSALNAYLSGTSEVKKINKQTIYPFGINISQATAIRNAMENQLSLIQGPPGTGKTQSILNIIANEIINNQVVAVVSSNNEAVKNVEEKLEKKGYGFISAFLGNSEARKNFYECQPKYPEEIVTWSQSPDCMNELLSEIKMHEENLLMLLNAKDELAITTQLIFEYEHEFSYFKDYLNTNKDNTLERLSFYKVKDEKILELLMELKNKKHKKLSIVDKFVFCFKYGIYKFKQFDDIESLLVDIQNSYYQSKINSLTQKKIYLESKLSQRNFELEIDSLVTKSQKYFNGFLYNKYFTNCEGRIEFDEVKCRRGTEFGRFVKEYPVILSTTHSIGKALPRGYLLDNLIIDEASQVELVPGIIALNSSKKAVIVGDIKQLPHIPDEQISVAQYEEWHLDYEVNPNYSYKTHSMLSSFNAIFKTKIANVLLREHYRCHPRIIGFCNQEFYENKLICHSTITSKKPLVLIKTVAGNHTRFGSSAANRITNLRELESLADKKFMRTLDLDDENSKTIGFIAPFRGQANEANDVLPSDFQRDTVHKFQGRECDIVMFSSVLDSKKQSKRRMNFVDEPHLINVAVSRAKEKFILVSDVDVFKEKKGVISNLIRYIEYYEEDSILYSSDIRSIFDLLYSDYKEVLRKKSQQTKWKKSKYDSENLVSELLDKIFLEENYCKYKYSAELKLKEIIRNYQVLTEEEISFVKNNATIDFVIYNNLDRQPVLAIEVDGYEFHENNPKQQKRDCQKNEILKKIGLPLLRLKSNSSCEEEKIKKYL